MVTETTSATPLDGKCNARLKGKLAGQLCSDDPMPGRTRCRIHGGMSLRGADHAHFGHGANGQGGGEMFSQPFTDTEKSLIREWRRDPEEGMKQTLAEVLVVQRRALRAGAVEFYTRLTTAAGTLSRAIASLHQVPPADPALPGIKYVLGGDDPADYARDMTREPATEST